MKNKPCFAEWREEDSGQRVPLTRVHSVGSTAHIREDGQQADPIRPQHPYRLLEHKMDFRVELRKPPGWLLQRLKR